MQQQALAMDNLHCTIRGLNAKLADTEQVVSGGREGAGHCLPS